MQIDVKISQNAFRRKRSADEFPDDMDIELPVGESHVSIALHRNYHISNKVPVTVERHGKIVRQLIQDTQVIYLFIARSEGFADLKSSNLHENLHVQTKMAILSRRLILL